MKVILGKVSIFFCILIVFSYACCNKVKKEKQKKYINIEKYNNSKKYTDFDIFEFEGIHPISKNSPPPFIKYVTQEDSIFILIVDNLGNMIEKKFLIGDSVIFQIENLTNHKDYQGIFYNYFHKDYYISYFVMEYKQDGEKYTQCATTFEKVHRNHSYSISFDGDIQDILDPSLGVNNSFSDSLKNVLSHIKTYEKITLTDSSYIRHRKMQEIYLNYNIPSSSDVYIDEHYFKNLTQYKSYSVFWYKYLDEYKKEGNFIQKPNK